MRTAGTPNTPGWIAAIRFLTILPLGGDQKFSASSALPYFPICGLLVGCILLVIDWTANLFWASPIAAVCIVLGSIVITGALHLDGLADTFDGLYGQRPAAQRLAIMKDSRIGAMGMVAVSICLAIKVAGIMSLETHRSLWLLLVPAYARAAIPIAIKILPYGRPDGGTGQDFFEGSLRVVEFWALALVVLLSLSLGWDALKINLGFAAIVGLLLLWYRKKLGAITGDMMGALIEMTEATLFLLAATGWRG